MSGRFFTALAVAAAAIAFGASSALAAAQGCHKTPPCTSATCVYVDQGPPSSGACHKKTHTHTSTTPATTQPTYTQTTPSGTQHPKTKVKHPHRKHHRTTSKNKVPRVRVTKTSAPKSPPPSAVSAAFDLGSGPTALFAALLVAAALLAVGGGLRHGRRR